MKYQIIQKNKIQNYKTRNGSKGTSRCYHLDKISYTAYRIL